MNKQNITPKAQGMRKKKLPIILLVIAIILLPFVVIDIGYRLETLRYINEFKRIEGFFPEGFTEDPKFDYINRVTGDGLPGRFVCHWLAGGKPCPTVGDYYIFPAKNGEEMELARKIMRDAGYEIDPTDLTKESNSTCYTNESASCGGLMGHKEGYLMIVGIMAGPTADSKSFAIGIQPVLPSK